MPITIKITNMVHVLHFIEYGRSGKLELLPEDEFS